MNRWKFSLVLLGFCTLLLATSSFVLAAPKPANPKSAASKARIKSSLVTKREYCYVVAGVPMTQGQGVAAYLPQGRQIFIPFRSDGFRAITQMLNRLGEQGWEVVGYQDATGRTAGGTSWTLTRRK